jgi:ABC-type dipeptide/oligopeptide/nickel transport system permease component
MSLYVLRRLLQLIPVFLCASFLIFSIVHLLPGDPVQVMLGEERYDESQYRLLRKQLGLDRPLYMQYFTWLERLAQGDLGQSLRNQRAVLDMVIERYPATIYLALASLIL